MRARELGSATILLTLLIGNGCSGTDDAAEPEDQGRSGSQASGSAPSIPAGGANAGSGSAPSGSGSRSSTGSGSGTGSNGGRGGAAPAAGGTGGGSGATPATGGDDLPCDVAAIIEAHCSTCHGDTPQFGASFSLSKAQDFRALAAKSTETIAERVLERVADDARPMPPPPNARLNADDRAVLEKWIKAGAKGESCETGSGGAAGSGGTSASGGMSGSGGATTEPVAADVQCYQMKARASLTVPKYTVPTTPDLYQCFNYAPPWGTKKVQVVSAKPLIDNAKVLHHWILYNTSDKVNDGTNASCAGAHPGAAFITGWAPGGDGLNLPADVGLRTETGGFSLEIHYNNSLGQGQLDASGVEVCVTEKLRPHEAAVHWLGTQNLNKMSASGTCSPTAQSPVTVLSSSPHMHLQGRHMKTMINRKGGGTDMLVDQPFDFNTQISYPTRATINPGDTLTTTCTYAAPTPFGQGTNQEMCYNFVIAYPAGGLAQAFSFLRKYDCTG